MIYLIRRGTDRPTWRWLMLMTLCVLTACQSASATGTPDAAPDLTSADSVHAVFVRALQHNDRSAVVALTVEDQQAVRADTWLRMIASYRDSTATEGSYATGGSLTDVEVAAERRVPQVDRGRSLGTSRLSGGGKGVGVWLGNGCGHGRAL